MMRIITLALPAILLLSPLISAELVEYKFEVYPRRATNKDAHLSSDCAVNNKVLVLVNDQLPGVAPIRAKVGDTVRLTVENNSPTDVLTVHMHGLTMKGQPYVDGVPSVTQCGSPPLSSQVYENFEKFSRCWHSLLARARLVRADRRFPGPDHNHRPRKRGGDAARGDV